MAALYKIANEYNALCNEDMDPELISDTLEGIEGEFTDKVEQILAVIKNEQSLAAALKAESKALSDRAKATENRIESMKRYIATSMLSADMKKLNAGIHAITIRKPSASLQIDNADLVPVDFKEYETVVKINKNAIKSELKLGKEIEGVSLVLGKPSLIIK